MTSTYNGSSQLRAYAYDGAGNITTDTRPGEAFVFTYNKRNRPSSVTRNGLAYASYGYNALEQLTTRSTSAVGGPVGTVAYLYDLDGHVIAEADAATGATTREYIWAAANDNNPVDLPLAVAEAANLYMVHADHLGRPIRMTDATKATVFQAAYKPFGEVITLSGTKANNLRFPGQYFQIETGLAYNWHRHYDATTGRYTQPDPLRFVDGPSVYAYAGSSPFMYKDKHGLEVGATGGFNYSWSSSALFPQSSSYNYCSIGSGLPGIAETHRGSHGYQQGIQLAQTITPPSFPLFSEPPVEILPPNVPWDFDPIEGPGNGFEWRGNGTPETGEGGWFNPKAGQSIFDDRGHPAGIEPHHDYIPYRGGPKFRWFPYGLEMTA